MEQSWKQAKAAFGFVLAPPTLWLLLFFLAPMAVIWAYSFGENVGLTEIDISGTFKNYIRAFDPLYLGIFWKSAVTAGITTFLCLVIGFPVAMGIAFASPKTKAWLLLLIMLPFWTNLLIRTYALMAVLRTQGFINTTYEWLWTLVGLSPDGFTPLELINNNFAVIFGLVYVHLPFMVLPLYANLEKHDPALLDAAQDLGANAWNRFWRVTFPLSLPGVFAGAALVFIPAFGIFAIPDILGGTGGIMIGNVIKQQFLDTRDWPFGSVLSIVLTLMAVGLAGLAALLARRSRL